jgi:hypothetical protein
MSKGVVFTDTRGTSQVVNYVFNYFVKTAIFYRTNTRLRSTGIYYLVVPTSYSLRYVRKYYKIETRLFSFCYIDSIFCGELTRT